MTITWPQIRIVTILAFVLSLAGIAHAQSGRIQPTPTPETPVRIATEEVKLNVLAYDEDGKFVNNVAADDLVITEDNILHQPTSVRRMPAHVLIVMDTGGELRWMKSLDQTRRVANALIDALKQGDTMSVMQYSDKAELIGEWTTDKSVARQAVSRAMFGRRSAFNQAVEFARDLYAKTPADNKHLVLITDGTDSYTDRSKTLATLRSLLATDVTVHVISYTNMELVDIEPRSKAVTNRPAPKAMPDEIAATLPNGVRDMHQSAKVGPTINVDRRQLKIIRDRKADLEVSRDRLNEIALATNGEMIDAETKEEMIEKAPLVAKMIDGSYVVSYIPKVPLDEGKRERNIIVTSKRAGLVVDSRRKLILTPK